MKYFDSVKIFIKFEEVLEVLLNTKDKNKLDIPQDIEIVKPKFGN